MIGDVKLKGHTGTERLFVEATVPYVRIRYRQEIHLKNLYMMLHDWFIHESWVSRSDTEWPEHYYLMRENPNMGNEMWIWWRFKKVPQTEASLHNSYYRFNLDVFWHVMGIKDIEVMKQGNKFKTNNADLEFEIIGRLELDYKHEEKNGWRDHPFLKHIHPFFMRRIFKAQTEKHRDELYREAYKLQEVIKTFLNMKRYMPTVEGQEWSPTYGSGDKEGLLPQAPQ